MINYFIKNMAGANERSKLLVVNYNYITSDKTSPYLPGVPVSCFRTQINWLNKHFELLPLTEAVAYCRSASLTKPTASIIFSSSYKTLKPLAAEYLKSKGIPATFLVSLGPSGQRINWQDKIRVFSENANLDEMSHLKRLLNNGTKISSSTEIESTSTSIIQSVNYRPIQRRIPIIDYIDSVSRIHDADLFMMSSDDINGLFSDGFEIGASIWNCPALPLEDPETAMLEIQENIQNVSSVTGTRIKSFSFPNAIADRDYNEIHLQMISRCRIELALTGSIGHFTPGWDPLQIPCMTLQGNSTFDFFRSVRTAFRSKAKIATSMGYETSH